MPGLRAGLRGYTLVICEKPDAAKRIAQALSDGDLKEMEHGGMTIHTFSHAGKPYVACSALGHLYTVADTGRKRSVYPAFDLEWVSISDVDRKKKHISSRIEAIRELSDRAAELVNGCDFDIEGETIGYNILKYACGGKESKALRAKFSTLTDQDLREAFGKLGAGPSGHMAEAGRTRHMVDFIWGVNLSRALSESFYAANRSYRTLSIGRVQGPTLALVVAREIEIRTFVPTPYWLLTAILIKSGSQFVADYEGGRIETLAEAERIKAECEGNGAIVQQLRVAEVRYPPPAPFNIGELQKEAFRVFGFTPTQTLGIAERLYLDALISYPRTSSQKLPPSIGYRQILLSLGRVSAYEHYVQELLKRELRPREGEKEDPAHPAIYPTGELPKRELEPRERNLYDLVVRRFFSVFGADAIRERVTASLTIENHRFKVSGRRTIFQGWLKYYGRYSAMEDTQIPNLVEGDHLIVREINLEEKFTQRPSRFNQASLLDVMEKNGIGTKTTRAEIISTLYKRRYIAGDSISATDVGFSITELMKAHNPTIISIEMTKDIESSLDRIEMGQMRGDEVIERGLHVVSECLTRMKASEFSIGRELRQALISTVWANNILGSCPLCRLGKLTVIRSRRTRKRFVGCTNYRGGCRASAPLPQRGAIRASNKTCVSCGWPVVYVRMSRPIPWKLCVNVDCPTKVKRREVPALP